MKQFFTGGFSRIYKAFFYSLSGLKACFRNEVAFRQEILLMIPVLPIVFLLDVSGTAKALMIASLILILLCELINTAIEACIDRISDEIHPLSKKAKDVGSALVFIAFLNAGVVFALILWG